MLLKNDIRYLGLICDMDEVNGTVYYSNKLCYIYMTGKINLNTFIDNRKTIFLRNLISTPCEITICWFNTRLIFDPSSHQNKILRQKEAQQKTWEVNKISRHRFKSVQIQNFKLTSVQKLFKILSRKSWCWSISS